MRLGLREAIFVAVMIGLLASSYFLVFNKSNGRRSAVQAEIDRKQRALSDLKRATAGIEDVKGKIQDLQKAIAFFESKLPQKRQIETVLREVWQLAEANKLNAKTVKTIKSQRTTAGYSEQTIEMSLSGKFEGFYEFLQQLERLPRLTRVMSMDLEKIDGRDGEMEALLTLSLFYEPEPEELKAAEAEASATADAR